MSLELTAYLSDLDLCLTQWNDHIIKRTYKPHKFGSHSSLKISFTYIWGLLSSFVECESFVELNIADILALCETNLDESVDSGSFSVRGYLPLIRKVTVAHMHGLAVYVKEELSFAWHLSQENSVHSYLSFQLALLHSVSDSFFAYWSPSLSLCTVCDAISANVLAFGDFNVHHKDWLTYSGELKFFYLELPYSNG